MLENPFRPLCVEAREQIAQWLASHGMPYPEPEQRFRFTTKDGARGEGTIETYAAMMRGTDSREHFAAQAIELIDLILREAERAPWQAIGWAHQLGELGGDARLAGMEPVWMIGQKSQAGAVRGGEARTTKERDRRLAEAFLSKRENAKKETSDTEIKRAIGRSNKMKGEAARKAIDRGLRLLGKI